jgi:hypothetical protein
MLEMVAKIKKDVSYICLLSMFFIRKSKQISFKRDLFTFLAQNWKKLKLGPFLKLRVAFAVVPTDKICGWSLS